MPPSTSLERWPRRVWGVGLMMNLLRIGHAVSSRKRVDIIAKAKALGVKVTNAKAKVTTES